MPYLKRISLNCFYEIGFVTHSRIPLLVIFSFCTGSSYALTAIIAVYIFFFAQYWLIMYDDSIPFIIGILISISTSPYSSLLNISYAILPFGAFSHSTFRLRSIAFNINRFDETSSTISTLLFNREGIGWLFYCFIHLLGIDTWMVVPTSAIDFVATLPFSPSMIILALSISIPVSTHSFCLLISVSLNASYSLSGSTKWPVSLIMKSMLLSVIFQENLTSPYAVRLNDFLMNVRIACANLSLSPLIMISGGVLWMNFTGFSSNSHANESMISLCRSNKENGSF